MKNLLDELKSRLERTKEKISDLKIEIILFEEQREKKIKEK